MRDRYADWGWERDEYGWEKHEEKRKGEYMVDKWLNQLSAICCVSLLNYLFLPCHTLLYHQQEFFLHTIDSERNTLTHTQTMSCFSFPKWSIYKIRIYCIIIICIINERKDKTPQTKQTTKILPFSHQKKETFMKK